ncbi:MAG: hypothetical protein C0616_02370 [Desulfuromonas sp.]|nr:MAG: hypothetical protein C0616_02370 [Desulfuromonas sp.]
MKRGLAWLCTALTVLLLLTACSSNGGDDVKNDNDFPKLAGPPANLEISSQNLIAGESYTITAYVTDSSGDPVNDGILVNFSAIGGEVTPIQSSTVDGEAETTFNIDNNATSAEITAAFSSSVSDDLTLNIVGSPANIVMTNGLTPGTSLAPGGETNITAYVTDSVGQAVDDGTTIYFFTSGFGAEVDATAPTKSGIATAHFVGGIASGTTTVNAATAVNVQTGTNVTASVDVPITNGDAAAISFISSSPDSFIGIKGSGQNQFAELTFQVLDVGGNPVPDGTEIKFDLTLSLHGGESLLADTGFTIGGLVVARVQAGFVAGPLRVQASYTDSLGNVISTQGVVSVVSGPPAMEHLTISQELFNQAVFVYEGLLNKYYAILADRYGNVVKDGTPVSFITDCGRIGTNADGVDALESFQVSTFEGRATAEWRSSNPIKTLCNIVAYTPGQESYDDLNGNGQFDEGIDVCTANIGEPYIDEDHNGSYTTGELYIDTDADGVYDLANTTCDMETIIWTTAKVTQSSYINPILLEVFNPTTLAWEPVTSNVFGLTHEQSLAFRYYVQDIYGNALVEGTKISVLEHEPGASSRGCSASNTEKLVFVGQDEIELPDQLGPGNVYEFFLTSASTEDTDAQTCQIDIDILTPDFTPQTAATTSTPGNNGGDQSTILVVNWALGSGSGTGLFEDTTPPTVEYTIPIDGATQVLADSSLTIVFDEPMNPLTVIPEYITLTDLTEGTQRPLYVDTLDSTATTYIFNPDGDFNADHDYRVNISTNVEDLSGNNLASSYSFDFTSIGALQDPPRVEFISPGPGATNVRASASIVVRFSQKMDFASIVDSDGYPVSVFLDSLGGTSVPLSFTSVSTDGTSFVFDPVDLGADLLDPGDDVDVDLALAANYRITVTANARSDAALGLIPMDKDWTSVFTTGLLP